MLGCRKRGAEGGRTMSTAVNTLTWLRWNEVLDYSDLTVEALRKLLRFGGRTRAEVQVLKGGLLRMIEEDIESGRLALFVSRDEACH